MRCEHCCVAETSRSVFAHQMVPIKEMTDVLKVVKETANLKPKMWVRLKRGIYKDDLAQVRLLFARMRRRAKCSC